MIILRRSARRGPLFFIILVLLIVGILLYRSRLLLGLLFEDGARDAVFPAVILDPEYHHDASREVIPKIIHQTYKNNSIPKEWQPLHDQAFNMTVDYEYMFWTDDSANEFIATHYAWFLPTYKSYPYNIQRADALRYFLLVHYGGIYLDLDIAPYRPLDILLPYPAWACRTLPTGISNDALGSVPNHPFYRQVINSLEAYNRNWLLPYITVMYSTGPLFLSVMWKEYISKQHIREERFNVLMIDEERFGNTYGFFNNTDGGSWHQSDIVVISWMGEHWGIVTIVGFIIGFGITGIFWSLFKNFGERSGYKLLERTV